MKYIVKFIKSKLITLIKMATLKTLSVKDIILATDTISKILLWGTLITAAMIAYTIVTRQPEIMGITICSIWGFFLIVVFFLKWKQILRSSVLTTLFLEKKQKPQLKEENIESLLLGGTWFLAAGIMYLTIFLAAIVSEDISLPFLILLFVAIISFIVGLTSLSISFKLKKEINDI